MTADADEVTWWDRHGWDYPEAADVDQPDEPEEPVGMSTGYGWSALLLAVAVVGGMITLPVLGLTGGFGHVLAPALWALIATVVGVRLGGREPVWDLGDRRRVEPLLAWAAAYALTAGIGLQWLAGSILWWVCATVLTTVAPVLPPLIRSRRRPSGAQPGEPVSRPMVGGSDDAS